MDKIIHEALSKFAFLAGASPEVLERLAVAGVIKTYQPGEAILLEGTTGREVYLLLDGLVEVVKHQAGETMLLAQRGAGEVFGEMAFFEAQPRFATVRAVEPTHALEISETAMRTALAEQPALLFSAMEMLSARLRATDLHMIEDLQRKNQELERAYRELQQAQAALLEKERLERELELARDLQQSILPTQFPHLPGLECASRNRPARQVGGDFFDVIPLGKRRLGLVIADVSDKGMPAAIFMALSHSMIRAEARRSSSPRRVLMETHRHLLEVSQANMFVTVFYGVLDLETRSLCYVRAGHDRPLLLSPQTGECRFLTAKGILLGMIEEIELEEVTISLQPGDRLVLYTDGITDANSTSGDFFGVDRLREVVCTSASENIQEFCDAIFEQVDQFQQGANQYDDMTLLVVGVD
ncbi:MAG: SpoIIE family protein phosphatase [Anaerolineales bacterium]|nr:SpoIIE family protein phosphatase [Anaerolineales bacterium]